MFSYKTFRTDKDVILAIADRHLVGKTFEEKNIQLEVSEEFYSGQICGEEEAVKIAKESTIINAVGNNIIRLLTENKLIQKDRILKIGGIPHAQTISVE